MPTLDARCLDHFADWLTALSTDATELAEALEAEASRPAQSSPTAEVAPQGKAVRLMAGALNYLFKSLDLIQDGIEDLGYVDDCFVLRVAAELALPSVAVQPKVLVRLAEDAEIIKEFLGEEDYARLQRYTESTTEVKARGRTATEIAEHEDARTSFLSEVKAWSSEYQPPSFSRDEKNLVRLRSFLATKLPS